MRVNGLVCWNKLSAILKRLPISSVLLSVIVTMNRAADVQSAPVSELAAASRAGDDVALETLIQRVEPRIYALAKTIVRDATLAEDITQDVLMKLLRKLNDIGGNEKAIASWTLVVTRNAARSALRTRRTRAEMEQEADPVNTDRTTHDDAQPASTDMLIALEDVARTSAAIDRLPLALREIVILRFFHELTPAEIGEVIGDSGVNVRVRLFRAIRELRTLLS